MTPQDVRILVDQANEGDGEAWREIYLSVKFREAMEKIFHTHDLRNALIIIGKHYGGGKGTELTKIFGLDRTSIYRVLNAAKN